MLWMYSRCPKLQAEAPEIHELTKRLEILTKYVPAWYAGMRARVEARAALEQAERWAEYRLCYIVSTHCARHSAASKGSAKYPVALLILPSSKSIMSQTFMRLPS
jgi:hypothetical protein